MRLLLQLQDMQGEIADYWADNNMPMERKPVTAALDDFASGKVRVKDLVKEKDAN